MYTKMYAGRLDYTKARKKLLRCRENYERAWSALQSRFTGTTCDQPRYVDNGNGTITDNLTGLAWEKKSDDGGIQDKDAGHSWSTGAPYNGDGTAFATFLTFGLNSAGFAGANDWRLPTLSELQTILLPEPYPCATSPCVPAVFDTDCAPGCTVTTCSCTQSGPSALYWSATGSGGDASAARYVSFYDGDVGFGPKAGGFHVRAVRGGW
ncbi:DUF1566 domain-containing protein [Candidatus Binatia bacterium]|nr:DUF1566 domain-containing protein [Candidatus Binatia bacterium]